MDQRNTPRQPEKYEVVYRRSVYHIYLKGLAVKVASFTEGIDKSEAERIVAGANAFVQSETLFMDAAPQPSTATINATVPSQEGVGQGDAAAAAPADDKKERAFHIGAQNDALFIISGEAPALNNDYPRHDADRTCIAKVYDEAEARRLVEAANKGIAMPSAVAASLDVDLGPYDAISSLKGARYKLIVPGDQPFMAKVIAEVPDLEMARKIIAALRAPRSASVPRKPTAGMLATQRCTSGPCSTNCPDCDKQATDCWVEMYDAFVNATDRSADAA